MRRLAAAAGIFVAAIFAGVLVARAGPEHDTTRDGYVDLRDALDVLSHFGEAPGTPTPVPILHEVHIVLTEPRDSLNWNLTHAQQGSWRTILTPVDSDAYPTGTTFRLWAAMHSNFGGEICLQLVDVTQGFPGTAIDGAVLCASSQVHQGRFSAAFSLPDGPRVVSIQPLPTTPNENGTLGSARLIATIP